MEAGLTLREVEDIVFSNTRTLEFFNSADYKQVIGRDGRWMALGGVAVGVGCTSQISRGKQGQGEPLVALSCRNIVESKLKGRAKDSAQKDFRAPSHIVEREGVSNTSSPSSSSLVLHVPK